MAQWYQLLGAGQGKKAENIGFSICWWASVLILGAGVRILVK
jgi:hypothetical protein